MDEESSVRIRLALVGVGFLVFAACQSVATMPAATPTITPMPTVGPSAEEEEAYLMLVNQVMNDIGQLTRVVGSAGVQLSSMPEKAAQADEVVRPAKDTFELLGSRLGQAAPPPGYEQLHQQLLDALALYARAAEALLLDEETGEADYWRFHDLMQQAGKNFHAAGGTLGEIRSSE